MKRLLAVMAFTGLCGVCATGAVATEDDLELARVITIEQIDKMHGLTFEAYVCRLLESRGYSVENIRASNDFGVDAVATQGKERIAIQIKRSKAPIDRRAISDASAGKDYYKCKKAMVITKIIEPLAEPLRPAWKPALHWRKRAILWDSWRVGFHPDRLSGGSARGSSV